MQARIVKSLSEILVRVEFKKISDDNKIEEFDSGFNKANILLSSKCEEYMVRVGDSNNLCFKIIIQLLTKGKVRVDFRNTTERVQLIDQKDRMSRIDAVKAFDAWVAENRPPWTPPEKTQKIILELPQRISSRKARHILKSPPHTRLQQ
jgi:hypothetical protein